MRLVRLAAPATLALAVVAAPLIAETQAEKVPRIGILELASFRIGARP
jgi:hypothetical protein